MVPYKFDTHVHTSETSPCGILKASELVHLYKNAGYAGIVITDHYFGDYFRSLQVKSWKDKIETFLSGYRSAYEEGQKIGFPVLLGMEIRFDENYNDYLVYGINEALLFKYKELYALGLKKFKSFAKKHGILIYQAHPYRSWITPANPIYLDGVEVFNGNPRHDSNNHLALSYARKNKLKMLSGSDCHQIEDLAIGGIVLNEVPTSSEEFARLLSNDGIISLLPD